MESEETQTAEEGIKEIKHIFPSEYEFGKAGNRHKIKYFSREELKEAIKWLSDEGLTDSSEFYGY